MAFDGESPPPKQRGRIITTFTHLREGRSTSPSTSSSPVRTSVSPELEADPAQPVTIENPAKAYTHAAAALDELNMEIADEELGQYFLHDGPPTTARRHIDYITGATAPDEVLSRPEAASPEVSDCEAAESIGLYEVRAIKYDKDLAPNYYYPDHQAKLKKPNPNPNGKKPEHEDRMVRFGKPCWWIQYHGEDSDWYRAQLDEPASKTDKLPKGTTIPEDSPWLDWKEGRRMRLPMFEQVNCSSAPARTWAGRGLPPPPAYSSPSPASTPPPGATLPRPPWW